jgi:uridylate kinase
MPAYNRILLKISGEALGGDAGFGFDSGAAGRIAGEIHGLTQAGVSVGLVTGGGNFFRGVNAQDGLRRVTVDSMGMLATAVNALAMADLLQARGCEAEVLSAVGMEPLVARYDRRRALDALDNGKVVIFAAGTGNPFFSTDTAAALRAAEIGAGLLAKATKVDGIYDADPVQRPDARRYEKISYAEVLERGLAVMDAAAVALCRENRIPVLVFNLNQRGAILEAARGGRVGTLMSA